VDPALGGPRGKFSIYENGFRTPMIVSWPGTLPAGRRDDSLVSALDLMPTLLDFAGVASPPPERNGLSLRGLLEGRASVPRERLIGGMRDLRVPPDERDGTRLLGIREESGFFLREPAWRYVWMPERGVEALYAIDEDPWEQHDLSARHPERVARSRAAVQAWRRRMAIPAPTRNPPARAPVAPARTPVAPARAAP
jgi:arylsulfatase A-like enzyme